MRNPERTKEKILTHSGSLFNTKGYKATSLSDITKAAGLTKGAIYKHFQNKEKLEEAAFDEMAKLVMDKLGQKIKMAETAPEKLRAIVSFYKTYVTHPCIQGGCPLLNTAVEADDANPVLRKKAVRFLGMIESSLQRILENGKRNNQLKSDLNTEHFSSVMIALLEGAIMMSRLKNDTADMDSTVQHLNGMISDIED
ncbi:transcriptional regulator, TetR family [Fodinibius roseus]|uniref:Transcriptional regulator, TetR family n=1 Tax=Fodinibius roseus TaxID=1194090 RepID=A0A1M4YU01_9BACT|nr:TetR/AcrR family transcriptional regulator [Fodinibius roseus]SHF09314.1 transcriptional regulator, TetR family [Fodinibius roseus]